MVRRHVAVGATLGLALALATSITAMFEAAVTTAAVALIGNSLGALALWLKYRAVGLGPFLESLASQLLAYIALAPPIYTLLLRLS